MWWWVIRWIVWQWAVKMGAIPVNLQSQYRCYQNKQNVLRHCALSGFPSFPWPTFPARTRSIWTQRGAAAGLNEHAAAPPWVVRGAAGREGVRRGGRARRDRLTRPIVVCCGRKSACFSSAERVREVPPREDVFRMWRRDVSAERTEPGASLT